MALHFSSNFFRLVIMWPLFFFMHFKAWKALKSLGVCHSFTFVLSFAHNDVEFEQIIKERKLNQCSVNWQNDSACSFMSDN